MKEIEFKHGGKRSNAGRHKVASPRKNVTFRLAQATIALLHSLENQSRFVESAVLEKLERGNNQEKTASQ
jgi:hypothetical protein